MSSLSPGSMPSATRRSPAIPPAVCLLSEPCRLDHAVLAGRAGHRRDGLRHPTDDAGTFDLRWFSPSVEIDLCGHATLASAHALRARGVVDGTRRSPSTPGAGRSSPPSTATSSSSTSRPTHAEPAARRARGSGTPGVVVGAGTTSVLRRGGPGQRGGRAPTGPTWPPSRPPATRRCSSPPPPTAGSGADYVLRVFGPNVGIDEDPATGSAQCSAGPYWAAVLGRPDWWPTSSRPGVRCSTCAPTATGCTSGGMPPRCSPATCAR
jgi:hypothetical protein